MFNFKASQARSGVEHVASCVCMIVVLHAFTASVEAWHICLTEAAALIVIFLCLCAAVYKYSYLRIYLLDSY